MVGRSPGLVIVSIDIPDCLVTLNREGTVDHNVVEAALRVILAETEDVEVIRLTGAGLRTAVSLVEIQKTAIGIEILIGVGPVLFKFVVSGYIGMSGGGVHIAGQDNRGRAGL